jgi:hypothetical protein
MSLRAVVVALFAFMANGAPAAEPPLHDGFNAAIKTLGELREHFSTIVRDPEGKAEVARALPKLSGRLDSLVRAKLTFTETLINAKWPQDRNKVAAATEVLEDQLHKSRFALTDVFAALPPEWQTRGGDLQAKLDWVPHGKWRSLDDAARDLGAESTSPEQLRAESDAFVALVRQLEENADGIVTDLAKPEAQQSH